MRRTFVLLLSGITLLTVSLTSHGNPWGWLVQKTTGNAVYSLNGTAQLAVQKGLVFDRGTTVQTGDNGRVLLARSEESVFIGPLTVASLAAPPTGMKTTVTLQRGQASFAVSKRSQKHFSVDTPFLAAVVKGTKFDVTVGAFSAQVSVTEGVVEVRALKSGQVAQLLAGQRAIVNDGGNLEVTGKGKLVERGTPEPAIIEPELISAFEESPENVEPQREAKSGKNTGSGSGSKGKSGKGSSGSGSSGSGSSGSGSSGSGSSGSSGSGSSGSDGDGDGD
jgi:hypothetical protein